MKLLDLEQRREEAKQYLSNEQYVKAVALYGRLARVCPNEAEIWFGYGCAAAGAKQLDLAAELWCKARALLSGDSEFLLEIGHAHQTLRQTELARACFLEAAATNPRISVAALLERSHNYQEARVWVEECLAIDPRDEQALYLSALLDRRENKIEHAESRLRDLIASEPKHPYVVYACRYELAQILDRTGRFDEAMLALSEAKRLVRSVINPDLILNDAAVWLQQLRDAARNFPKCILRRWSKRFPEQERLAVPSLALLAGHPRSGTTLLEQILGAHPKVADFDETPVFGEVLLPEYGRSRRFSAGRLNALRSLYIQTLQKESKGRDLKGKILLDKNPWMTAHLPTCLRVFPEMRVIIALRDPRDVVISVYFLNSIPNALSLEEVARNYANLMEIWLAIRRWEGFAWLESRYEDTVADLKREGQRVMKFLDMEWQEEQAQFYERSSKKEIVSPPYNQVTQPVYARSVNRWRSYEKHIAPILPLLEPFCHAFGYS